MVMLEFCYKNRKNMSIEAERYGAWFADVNVLIERGFQRYQHLLRYRGIIGLAVRVLSGDGVLFIAAAHHHLVFPAAETVSAPD
jgi:hypothetical protein